MNELYNELSQKVKLMNVCRHRNATSHTASRVPPLTCRLSCAASHATSQFGNSTNYFKAIYNDSINSNNIITRINLASSVAGNGIYLVGGNETLSTSMGISRNYFGPVNIQKLKVTLYDEYGRIVVLNNMDWSLELLFECVYS